MVENGASRQSADVVVIGAGVIGSAVALELARQGRSTIVIDKLPAAGYGSTSSSSAVVRFNYSTHAGVAMAWEGVHYWTAWADHVGPIDGPLVDFENVPMIQFTDADTNLRCIEFFDALGVPYENLDVAALAERFPLFDLRAFGPPARLDDHEASFWQEPTAMHTGGIVMTSAGYVSDPQLAAQNLAAAAIAAGAEFRFNAEVVSIDATSDSGRVSGVTLADGASIEAPVVVNVGGPHAAQINRLAGVTGDMGVTSRALRREVFVAPAPTSAEPECDELEWIDDADVFDESMTDDEHQLLVLRTARRVRDLGVPITKRGLVSLYDATPDWTPIYDRSNLDGYYMAIGTSGNQFKNAPIVGRCMAELIAAVEQGADHDAAPVSVIGPHTGHEIDLGTFSRLRTVSADAPSTVLG